MADVLERVFQKYKQCVLENPQNIGKVESACRMMSYLISGKSHNSLILSELLYSSSNLMVLLNDAILQKATKIVPKVSMSQERLMYYVTLTEYIEVFVELAARRLWGEIGSWVMITAIQILKAALRFLLLFYYKSGIQPSPPVPPVNRETFDAALLHEFPKNGEPDLPDDDSGDDDENQDNLLQLKTFTLKRSGRVMRRLSDAPPLHMRDWKLPAKVKETDKNPESTVPSILNTQRMCAESIHIMKPITHLLSMYIFGQASWKPWLVACGMDISSLSAMGNPEELNTQERGELRRRTLMMLYYLFRSPFYNRISEAKIILLLKILADNIPGMSLFLKPLMEYLPYWQKVYFYIWST
ncbi:hypothetical protein ScPMuIL_016305 [Solemya velum]